jgi:hypothetical protein
VRREAGHGVGYVSISYEAGEAMIAGNDQVNDVSVKRQRIPRDVAKVDLVVDSVLSRSFWIWRRRVLGSASFRQPTAKKRSRAMKPLSSRKATPVA